MAIVFDRRHSLAKMVASQMKKSGMKLEPGESLHVSITGRRREAGDFWITCPQLASSKMDKIFASEIETIELGYKRRYEALHNAGFEYVGQLWRTFRFSSYRGRKVKIKGITEDVLKRIGAHFVKLGLTPECERVGFHSWSCGPKELKKLRTVPVKSFLLEVRWIAHFRGRDFDKSIREEFSKSGILTLGDLLDAGYEKAKGCFVRARARTFNPTWNGEKISISTYGLGTMDSTLEVLSKFGLKLENKVVRGKKNKHTPKDPLDF